ncbi:glycosidase [Elusimicrobiota bacterium]
MNREPDILSRRLTLMSGQNVSVDLNHPVHRFPGNPLLSALDVNKEWADPGLRVTTVHNAGAASYGGETIMLFRSHLRSGMSVLGIARSADGMDKWRVDARPALLPAREEDTFAPGTDKHALIEAESGGVEDPRITRLGDTYLITYSAYHSRIKNRVRVCLASTSNFKAFTRWGPVLDRDMRNVVIFPEKIRGRYAALFRPNDTTAGDVGGIFTGIRIGFGEDWRTCAWDIPKDPIIRSGDGPSAISDKIGPGAPPLKTPHGWLSIFHGVRSTMDGNPYVLSAALHDPDDPARVKVSDIPILFPSQADCRTADEQYVHVPNVVFTCGALRKDDGTILLYYGGNDTVMNLGLTHEDVLAALCERYGRDPLTGERLYSLLHGSCLRTQGLEVPGEPVEALGGLGVSRHERRPPARAQKRRV